MHDLPQFPYHRDPIASGSIRTSKEPCECCGKSRGALFSGVIYARPSVKNLCPWCIAEGAAADRYDATFFDADFRDENGEVVVLPSQFHREVFDRTIGFATFNPFGWWVHCGLPAEYVSRNEPYNLIFECRVCRRRHAVEDFD